MSKFNYSYFMRNFIVPMSCFGILGGLWMLLFLGYLTINQIWQLEIYHDWLAILVAQFYGYLVFLIGLVILRLLLGGEFLHGGGGGAGEWVWRAYVIKLLVGVVFVVLSGDVSLGWFGPFRIAIGWAAIWCYLPVILLKKMGRPISFWDIRWPIILDAILYCVLLLNREGAAELLAYGLITMFASLPLYLYAINLFLRPLSSKADGRRAVWKTGLYILFMPWCLYCMVGFMVFF